MLQAIQEELKPILVVLALRKEREETTIRAAVTFAQAGHGTPC